MDPGTATAWIELVKSLGFGFTVGLLLFIFGLYKRWWVFGWYATMVEKQRDAWELTTRDATTVVKKAVEREERRL